VSQETRDIRDNVSRILLDAGIKFSVRYIGATSQPSGEGKTWDCDEWKCTFTIPPKKSYDFDFYTGTGHRNKGKPQAPHVATVLHSLLLDSEAIDRSFSDWCSELGMDSDSIKALNTYNECCKTGETLRKFPREVLTALREALQNY
jgi:hypothetical protein